MKSKLAFLTVALAGMVGVAALTSGSAIADNNAAVTTAVVVTTPALGDHEFVGSSKCKMCHKDVYTSWAETSHAKAFDLLKPNEAAEAKTKAKLDPAKDYTTDEACIGCHVTGFGKEGGYAVVSDEKAAKKMAKLEGVGCEMCHGPGKDYNAVKKTIKKEKRKYKFEELAAAGMVKIEATTCTACHNDKSPTYDASAAFDFDKAKADVAAVHTHVALELRED